MANCHELTLLTLPAFVQVMSVVAAKIVLLWSIIAPRSSVDNLASTYGHRPLYSSKLKGYASTSPSMCALWDKLSSVVLWSMSFFREKVHSTALHAMIPHAPT